jgi:hypothetical protein
MREASQQVAGADSAAAGWLLRRRGQQPRRLRSPLSHTVGQMGRGSSIALESLIDGSTAAEARDG